MPAVVHVYRERTCIPLKTNVSTHFRFDIIRTRQPPISIRSRHNVLSLRIPHLLPHHALFAGPQTRASTTPRSTRRLAAFQHHNATTAERYGARERSRLRQGAGQGRPPDQHPERAEQEGQRVSSCWVLESHGGWGSLNSELTCWDPVHEQQAARTRPQARKTRQGRRRR